MRSVPPGPHISERLSKQYGCGPIRFEGNENALYERHLLFDHAIAVADATPRDRFEAAASSVRDVLAQRWVLTEKTYEAKNPSGFIIFRWSS